MPGHALTDWFEYLEAGCVPGRVEAERRAILDPASYAASQPFGARHRDADANCIVYPSVGDPGGTCIGGFRPRAVGLPHQERHLHSRWNGDWVDRYFDYSTDQWIPIPA